MLSKSQTRAAVEFSLLVAKPIRDTERQLAARRALMYLESAKYQEQDLTAAWLEQYHPDAREFWQKQPKSVFNIFAQIVRKLATTYGKPVRREWPAGSARWEKAWARVVEGGEFDSTMQDTDELTLAGGTTCVRPLVLDNGDPVRFALYTADQTEHTPNAVVPTEADQLVFSWENGSGESRTTTRHFWTAEKFAETQDDTLVPAPADWPDGAHPYGMIPAVAFRNKPARKTFFDEPATDLVLAALALNRGITDLTYALPAHCSPTAVLRGADKSKPLKLGLRSRVDIDEQWGGMEFVTPNAPIAEVIAALEFLLSLFLSSRGIPEDAFRVKQTDASGVAIVAKEASLSEWRQRRINQFRPLEQRLIRMAVMVQEIHDGHPCAFEDVPVPTITYPESKSPMSGEERQQWLDEIRMNTATPVDYLRAKDPTLGPEQALEKWQENVKFNRAANAAPVYDRKPVVKDEQGDGE